MAKKTPPTIFNAIKNFLLKTASGIEQIAEGLDDIEGVFSDYSDDFLSKIKQLLEQSKDTLDSLKEKGVETKSNAIHMIQEIIEDAKEGLSIDVIIEKSGLAKKQVQNVLSRLKEKGLVFTQARGIYSSSTSKKAKAGKPAAKAKKTAAKKKKKAAKKTATKAAKKAPAGKSQTTQAAQVLSAIEQGGEVSVKDLETKLTGLSKKSLQNTIFKLKQSGKIVSPRRGIYKLAE